VPVPKGEQPRPVKPKKTGKCLRQRLLKLNLNFLKNPRRSKRGGGVKKVPKEMRVQVKERVPLVRKLE